MIQSNTALRRLCRNPAKPAAALAALLLAATALLTSATASAATTIYRTVDEHGNVAFTDQPPKEGEPGQAVELNQSNSFTPPAKTERPGRSVEDWLRESQGAEGGSEQEDSGGSAGYQSLAIASPANDASVRDNAGNVVVSGTLAPALRPGHSIQLYLDGVLRQSGSSSTFQLTNVDRGTHRVELRIVGRGGDTVATSDPVTFHMQRRSVLLQPARSK